MHDGWISLLLIVVCKYIVGVVMPVDEDIVRELLVYSVRIVSVYDYA
jgi:hypothetical protein